MREKIIDFLIDIGIFSKYTLAGGLGALAYAIHRKKSFWEGVRDVIAGSIAAIYLAPFVAEKLNLDISFSGFLVGIVNIQIVSSLVEIFIKHKNKIAEAIKAAVKIINK